MCEWRGTNTEGARLGRSLSLATPPAALHARRQSHTGTHTSQRAGRAELSCRRVARRRARGRARSASRARGVRSQRVAERRPAERRRSQTVHGRVLVGAQQRRVARVDGAARRHRLVSARQTLLLLDSVVHFHLAVPWRGENGSERVHYASYLEKGESGCRGSQ